MPQIKANKRIFSIATLFLVAYLLGFMFDRGILFWNPKETHLGFSIEHFSNKLHERSSDMDSSLSYIAKLNQNKELSRENLSEIANYLIEEEFDEKAYTLLLYDNNQLKFWSNTQIDVSSEYNDTLFSKRILKTGSGYYLVNKKRLANRVYIGFSLIKNEYPIQNTILLPSFYSGLEVPSNVKIEINADALGIDVADNKGKFLLKLMPEYSTFKEKPYFFTSISFYLLALFLLLFLIYYSFKKLALYLDNYLVFILLLFVLFGLRYLSLIEKIPANIYHLTIFQPQYFSQSFWFASLGDFLFNATILFFIAFYSFRNLRFKQYIKSVPIDMLFFGLILSYYFDLSTVYIFNLIQNSSINFELYEILSLDSYSFWGYTIIALIFGALWLLVEKYVEIALSHNLKWSIGVLFLSSAIIIFYSLVFNESSYPYAFIFLFIFTGSVFWVRSQQQSSSYFSLVFLVILISLYTVFIIQKDIEQKKSEIEQVIAINLAAERDPIAELFFIERENELKNDTVIISELRDTINADKIRRHIYEKYLKGYLNKFDLQVTVCSQSDSLWIEDEGRSELCTNYFQNAVDFTGSKLRRSKFYFLDNLNGRISYFGWLKYNTKGKNKEVSLFLEFDSKLQTDETGYPELLLDKKVAGKSKYQDYNYAKYKFGTLVTQHGDFPYDIKLQLKQPEESEFSDYHENGFRHLAYWLDKNNVIIVSQKQNTQMDYLITFSYLFLGFNLLISFLLLSYRLLHGQFHIDFGLKWQIQFSMVSTLVISLLIVGGGTVFYILKLYQDKHNENLNEKIQSLNNELAHKLLYESELTSEWQAYDNTSLNDLLMKFADVLYIDVHLFNQKGELLATSRPELFKIGLQSRQMNFDAYNQLILQERQKFLHQEKIGNLTYLSAYLPFRNVDNKILAYMNLPYFSRQREMRAEISALLITVLNVFVLLILIATFVALFTSNRITMPLQLLQSRIRDIELGKSNQPIHYERRDEIGQLVKEYNRMLGELQKSAQLLGQSERESAWREMAKQIAHEIKNPLTPMKLSIQYLQRSWRNNDKDFGKRLERVSQTVIQQIDALSEIATAFSNFAKMPRSKMQVVNLVEILRNAVGLYTDSENVEITFDTNNLSDINVFIDGKEMQRVFINLIKNGIQAVPKERKATIEVKLKLNKKTAIVSIKDNGSGIPIELHDKLFRPNFTTKTAGMGLGLAIVKNIIEGENGKVWFDTELEKNTIFYVQLPVIEET